MLTNIRWDREADGFRRWIYKIEAVWEREPPELEAINGTDGKRVSFKLYQPMTWFDALRWVWIGFWSEEKPVD